MLYLRMILAICCSCICDAEELLTSELKHKVLTAMWNSKPAQWKRIYVIIVLASRKCLKFALWNRERKFERREFCFVWFPFLLKLFVNFCWHLWVLTTERFEIGSKLYDINIYVRVLRERMTVLESKLSVTISWLKLLRIG